MLCSDKSNNFFCNVTHLLRLTLLNISIRRCKFFKLIGSKHGVLVGESILIQAATAPWHR